MLPTAVVYNCEKLLLTDHKQRLRTLKDTIQRWEDAKTANEHSPTQSRQTRASNRVDRSRKIATGLCYSRSLLESYTFFGADGFIFLDDVPNLNPARCFKFLSELTNYAGIVNISANELPRRFQAILADNCLNVDVVALLETVKALVSGAMPNTPIVSTEVTGLMSESKTVEQRDHTDGRSPAEAANGNALLSIMDDTTLVVVRGSQLLHGLSVEKQLQLVRRYNLKYETLILPKGTAIFFCGGLIHHGAANQLLTRHYRMHVFFDFFDRRLGITNPTDNRVSQAIHTNTFGG